MIPSWNFLVVSNGIASTKDKQVQLPYAALWAYDLVLKLEESGRYTVVKEKRCFRLGLVIRLGLKVRDGEIMQIALQHGWRRRRDEG